MTTPSDLAPEARALLPYLAHRFACAVRRPEVISGARWPIACTCGMESARQAFLAAQEGEQE